MLVHYFLKQPALAEQVQHSATEFGWNILLFNTGILGESSSDKEFPVPLWEAERLELRNKLYKNHVIIGSRHKHLQQTQIVYNPHVKVYVGIKSHFKLIQLTVGSTSMCNQQLIITIPMTKRSEPSNPP